MNPAWVPDSGFLGVPPLNSIFEKGFSRRIPLVGGGSDSSEAFFESVEVKRF